MYIEPCCAHRQLPPLLRTHRVITFATHGDVTLDHLSRATSGLADGPYTLLLTLPTITDEHLTSVAHFLRRRWCEGVAILTARDQSELVMQALSPWKSALHYTTHPHICEQQVAFISRTRALIYNGAILPAPDNHLHHYCAYLGHDRDTIADFLEPIITRHRATPRHPATAPRVLEVLARQYFPESVKI